MFFAESKDLGGLLRRRVKATSSLAILLVSTSLTLQSKDPGQLFCPLIVYLHRIAYLRHRKQLLHIMRSHPDATV